MGEWRTDETIATFLERYRAWPRGQDTISSSDSLDVISCRWLAAFHLSAVRPLCRHFAIWASENLAQAASGVAFTDKANRQATDINPATKDAEFVRARQEPVLSKSELRRIFSALYQYETFCHLFGENEGIRRWAALDDVEINDMFFGVFDPWQVEGIACIDMFIRQKYAAILDVIQRDLCDKKPKYHFRGFNLTGLPLTKERYECKKFHNLV